jgi:hypothetical protein
MGRAARADSWRDRRDVKVAGGDLAPDRHRGCKPFRKRRRPRIPRCRKRGRNRDVDAEGNGHQQDSAKNGAHVTLLYGRWSTPRIAQYCFRTVSRRTKSGFVQRSVMGWGQITTACSGLERRIERHHQLPAPHLARVSASQMPPPIMKPPEMRDTSRVRRAEKNFRARPASSA